MTENESKSSTIILIMICNQNIKILVKVVFLFSIIAGGYTFYNRTICSNHGDTIESLQHIFHFNTWWSLFIRLLILNHIKLGRIVTFMKYFGSVISLIFLAKILFWNKIAFPELNSINVPDLVVDKPKKVFAKNIHQYPFFYSMVNLYLYKDFKSF